MRDGGDPQREVGAHILSIAVHPDFQGRRLGQELLQRGLDYLRGKGAAAVRLEVRPGNAPAVHLYEKHGFMAVGETSDSQGPWVVMIKQSAEPVSAR